MPKKPPIEAAQPKAVSRERYHEIARSLTQMFAAQMAGRPPQQQSPALTPGIGRPPQQAAVPAVEAAPPITECQCNPTLEQIQNAFEAYMRDKVKISMPGTLWIEGGTVVNPDEIFAGTIIVWNTGGVRIANLVLSIRVTDPAVAVLQVPYGATCRTSWSGGDVLAPGTEVSQYFVSVGGIGASDPGWPWGNHQLVHVVGRGVAAGSFELRAVGAGSYRIAGLARIDDWRDWVTSAEYKAEYSVID